MLKVFELALSSWPTQEQVCQAPLEVMPLQDSGGYTKSGELPTADPVHVTSDRELKHEVDSILKRLSPTAEWTVRIQVPSHLPQIGWTCPSCLHFPSRGTLCGFSGKLFMSA